MSTATIMPTSMFDSDEDWWDGNDDAPLAGSEAADTEQSEERERLQERMYFELLADELSEAVLADGSTRAAMHHHAFLEIVELGEQANPWLLERLLDSGHRPLWLRLLGTISSTPPGAGRGTISAAAQEWLRWGTERGYKLR